MKIFSSYICYSCREVFDKAPHGTCPRCESDNIYPLGWFERPAEERVRWFSLIRGRGRGLPTRGADRLMSAA